MDNLPTLLITGASGNVGTVYRRHLAEQPVPYALRCTDIKLPKGEQPDGDWHIGNLSDSEFVRQVITGVDTILHLGADPDPEADFYDSLLDNNFKSTYNVFQTAAEAGVKKIIYASSAQTVFGYQEDEPGIQVHSGMAVQPLNMYGVSKCFGEATAAVFAHSHKLAAICVRIGWFIGLDELTNLTNPDLEILRRVVTHRDLCHLFDCCLQAKDITYAIVHGLSNNRYPYLDLRETKALLGYAPQDDAFALTGILPRLNEPQ